ncbi:MAG: hypothetical protein ACP5L5_08650 [Vulcanisaeta sp.]|uniref:hypothetical protein n=2 Tax=Vulcanisaeta sp. TaxID=2020871 RepID=UPI003D097959
MTWKKYLLLAIILSITVLLITHYTLSASIYDESSSTPPPSSYVLINITAPNYTTWTIYANASNGWYAYYQGNGSQVFGPAYVGEPGTIVTFNVASTTNCEYPSITYEPSSSIALSEGANYEMIAVNCVPYVNATINVTGGGGIIMILSTPGFITTQSLIINGPTIQSMVLPVNTTLFIIAWPFYGYTLEGVYVDGTAINYTETPYGSFHTEVMLSTNSTITVEFTNATSSS